jgi:hypothetical protein
MPSPGKLQWLRTNRFEKLVGEMTQSRGGSRSAVDVEMMNDAWNGG